MGLQVKLQVEKGFAGLYLAILVLAVILGIGVSTFILAWAQQDIRKNLAFSPQVYAAAEAGMEDILLRMKKNMAWSSPYSFAVGNGTTTVTVGAIAGGARTLTAGGVSAGRSRKVKVVRQISTAVPEFFYGAQIGDGGIQMDNNSKIVGNVFSNGSIIADAGSLITDSAKVAGVGNKIEGATIQKDAFADLCKSSTITQVLHANSQTGCTYGSLTTSGLPINPVAMPISSSDVTTWKNDAQAGGVIAGSYMLSGTSAASLGPKKITGSLTVQNNAILTITGTLWVVGNVDIKNNAVVKLDNGIYETLSGVMVSDGVITLENDSVSKGSGQAGSYLLYLSDAALNPAIAIKNNAKADILYTTNGWIEVENNAQLREVTGYGIHLKNNAVITYEVGLQDAAFSSGSGAGWDVTSWKEAP